MDKPVELLFVAPSSCPGPCVPVVQQQLAELEKLRHDIERHIAIAAEHVSENETLRAFVAAFDRWGECSLTGTSNDLNRCYRVMLTAREAIGG